MNPAFIHATAEVHPEAAIGEDVTIWNWTKVREGARIGKGSSIGQHVYVDLDVVVGRECKIQNGVSLYRGLSLGDHVFVGPNATFMNDRFPRAQSVDWQLVPTIVEEGASVGANATIMCGITLGAYCMVGAGAFVNHDVPAHGLVVGQPARLIDYVSTDGHRLQHDISGPPPDHPLLGST
jgi:UDP-2-acetamido-3-amino-2,3-dideoxy-glucuronate N-acetyltransferase